MDTIIVGVIFFILGALFRPILNELGKDLYGWGKGKVVPGKPEPQLYISKVEEVNFDPKSPSIEVRIHAVNPSVGRLVQIVESWGGSEETRDQSLRGQSMTERVGEVGRRETFTPRFRTHKDDLHFVWLVDAERNEYMAGPLGRDDRKHIFWEQSPK